MDILKLIIGLVILAVFAWIFKKNINRKGVIHSLFRIDTVIGLVAGFYLIFTSIYSLVS
jgi:hypothetical protein